jgi:hypothetical protein
LLLIKRGPGLTVLSWTDDNIQWKMFMLAIGSAWINLWSLTRCKDET